jgi:hypothetical protein
MTTAVVFVSNKAYFHKFITTCSQLLTTGCYKGPICLVIGDDLKNNSLLLHELIIKNNIIIKHFPDIQFPEMFLTIQRNLPRDAFWFKKIFQYHKLHLFNTFFKQWDYIFYIDCGISIMADIAPMLRCAAPGKMIANSDAQPAYVWKLAIQFEQTHPLFTTLSSKYDLNIDYFQTTIMLYDTRIIEDTTYNDLYKLTIEYPISRTNDQGIIALYFTAIKPVFEQIKTHDADTKYYIYITNCEDRRFIMVKTLL